MNSITSSRCFHHPEREAAAVCPECRKHYCRECVTEHDGRMLCAQCLEKLLAKPRSRRLHLRHVKIIGRCLAGFVTAWLFFYYLGEALLSIPVPFHEGTIWNTTKPSGR